MNKICIVSSAPIRAEAKDSAEMISQLLFGEVIELLEQQSPWHRIKCLHDGYEGWIDEKQLAELNETFERKHYCFQLSHPCTNNHESIPLILGCSMPNFDGMNFSFNKSKFVYNGKSIEPGIHNKKHLHKIAMKYLNAPYLWGGRSPFGIDCSGYTQMIYSFLGIKLPRDAYQQAELGTTLNFVAEAQLGDLAYFGNEEKITHVGMVLEGQKIIHASGRVRIDTLDHVGIYNRETKKYSHKLKVIKRLLE